MRWFQMDSKCLARLSIWWFPISRFNLKENYKDSDVLSNRIDNISFSDSRLYTTQEYVGSVFFRERINSRSTGRPASAARLSKLFSMLLLLPVAITFNFFIIVLWYRLNSVLRLVPCWKSRSSGTICSIEFRLKHGCILWQQSLL